MRRLMLTCTGLVLLSLICCPASSAEKLVLVAGGGDGPDGGSAVGAQLKSPFGVDFDRDGNMYLVEMTGERVRKIDRSGLLTTIAGTGAKGNTGDGDPAMEATFNGMHSLAIAPDGLIYVSDTWNNRVRKIDPSSGKVEAVAGTGGKGYSGDNGPAVQAAFGGIYCVAIDPQGQRLYLADLDNRRVRMVDLATNTVSTVAGNGQTGIPSEGGEAKSQPLVDPRAVAVDRKGNVYILERNGHALRVVDSSGTIRTVAGTGRKGNSGDYGEALRMMLNGPKHLCIDLQDNAIIADTENHRILKYLPKEGRIVKVAGTGKRGTAGVGGPPQEAEFNQPHGVYVHPSGLLFITDSSNHRILKIVQE